MNPSTYAATTNHPPRIHALTEHASGKMLEIATPADDPNHIIEPPKPTAYASPPQSYPPCSSANAVSGMLSNTADKKPRPSAVRADACGKRSTGIIEASNTSESRKMELRNAPGSSSQSGRRIPADMRIA